ncbi:MAG: hypothetical protein H6816_10335 [Phycisphaerales bacterium]|nr:hypothetical protein [Phycisphaerales bacterium]
MSLDTLEMSPTARCRYCRYSLHGLATAVCPECGRPFDPEDVLSFDDPCRRRERARAQRVHRWRKWADSPSRARCILVLIATIYLLAATDVSLFVLSRRPNNTADLVVGLLRIGFVLVMVLAFYGRLRAGYARMRLRRLKRSSDRARSPRYASWAVWICCAITTLLAFGSPGFALRFALHRQAFDAAAAAQVKAGTSADVDLWIGGLHITHISLHNDGQVALAVDQSQYCLLFEPRGRAWEWPRRLMLLGGDWSLATFEPPYTIWDLMDLPFPRLSR